MHYKNLSFSKFHGVRHVLRYGHGIRKIHLRHLALKTKSRDDMEKIRKSLEKLSIDSKPKKKFIRF